MTDGVAAVETEVTISPFDVMMNVTSDGLGVTVGIAVAFGCRVLSTAEYVLVPRPDATSAPAEAGMEMLNAYGGGVGVGVGKRTLGSTVATVAEADEKNAETSLGDCTGSDELRSGYNPIIGDSLVSMPKLCRAVEHRAMRKSG